MSDYPIYLTSSIVSAIVTKTAIAPLERVKILKQVQSYYNYNKYNGLFNSLYTIYKNEGLMGFFKGNWANIVRVIPNYGIKFPLNDIFKNKIKERYNIEKLNFLQSLCVGVSSGITLISLTYPLDVIRTRMTLDKTMANYSSIYKCGKQLIKNEGVSSLYKGGVITLLTAPMYIGLQFSLYDHFKNK